MPSSRHSLRAGEKHSIGRRDGAGTALGGEAQPALHVLLFTLGMRIDAYSFGRITIDGVTYEHDVIVEGGEIRKRHKGPSKGRKREFGHTPLTAREDIPWRAARLWIGTGAAGRLPVGEDLQEEAKRRGIELLLKPTSELVKLINEALPHDTNLILHVTC